jgi:H+/Cl- antiporter ClcA
MHPLKYQKDLLIAVLVAYVVIDLLLAYMIKARHPGVLATLQMAMKDENIAIVLAIGVAAGVLAYYLARRMKE